MNNLIIRRLISKQCWKLMRFDDNNFEKANRVCSTLKLCKQAGNTIAIKVLKVIFINSCNLEVCL